MFQFRKYSYQFHSNIIIVSWVHELDYDVACPAKFCRLKFSGICSETAKEWFMKWFDLSFPALHIADKGVCLLKDVWIEFSRKVVKPRVTIHLKYTVYIYYVQIFITFSPKYSNVHAILHFITFIVSIYSQTSKLRCPKLELWNTPKTQNIKVSWIVRFYVSLQEDFISRKGITNRVCVSLVKQEHYTLSWANKIFFRHLDCTFLVWRSCKSMFWYYGSQLVKVALQYTYNLFFFVSSLQSLYL